MLVADKITAQVDQSKYISRDLSWLSFNERVLDQARSEERTIFERLKFLAITASNLDEFCMIRIGSLYNYIDYGKERIDYSGLREMPFRKHLLQETQKFVTAQNDHFVNNLKPLFKKNDFAIVKYDQLKEEHKAKADKYFSKTIFPMLTPMVFDNYHTFPILMNNRLIFGVTSKDPEDKIEYRKISFIQVPSNIPRFFELSSAGNLLFVPIESIIDHNIHQLFRNVEILSVNLFRITRNGDFTLEESEDIEANFLGELKRKLKTRRTGRVVRMEVYGKVDKFFLNHLTKRWDLDKYNVFKIPSESLIDFTGLRQIISHREFQDRTPPSHPFVPPISFQEQGNENIFEVLKEKDILLHHPYNNFEPVLDLIERAAEDPDVLSIKLTIYRLAQESRVTAALLRAAENGKHVSVLFEVKARFDEENNLAEAQRLQRAGCYVIYGVSSLKTHTKLLLIVRKEGHRVTRYVHLSSGNYNESTAKLYTDIGLLSTKDIYANDVNEFFNAITGHSQPDHYDKLITAPRDMRQQLIKMIRTEAENAKAGLSSGIAIKINSLQDKQFIEELYKASKSGVPIILIVRGICCLRPERKGLSENIQVRSIVGNYLEHSRIYYFHNNDDPIVCVGSADAMVRSFDRRIESLFMIEEELLKKQLINILRYNLMDNVNTYVMKEDGTYVKYDDNKPPFNIHKEFYKITPEIVQEAKLF